MQQRVQLVTLGVRDIAAARRFYIDGLGWEPMLALDDVLFFQVGPGLVLSMFDADKLTADAGVAEPVAAAAAPPGRITLGHNMASEADVDAELARAAAAGASITKPAQRAFWGGYHGFFTDPDGFIWEIAYNPGLVFSDDGTVAFTQAG